MFDPPWEVEAAESLNVPKVTRSSSKHVVASEIQPTTTSRPTTSSSSTLILQSPPRTSNVDQVIHKHEIEKQRGVERVFNKVHQDYGTYIVNIKDINKEHLTLLIGNFEHRCSDFGHSYD
ncbi:hypothetical protein BFW01_g638 [Lasiodiplodia theobromae]|uniref:Uncharacterized protein n=1 Tax=Lasiodiplodia theobromae TaxID=45133 RepID=A0A5N5CUC6_9PEZI|nr:CorA family metal ion transporter [Lasiodiplodia theobromae]KAB2568944.1 hypothetical protein DBV05_g12378 [Lasiodiplodia theobromae]KAF4544232.1 CorA family metal ion transporter [Lasiodiplodia theobromae]KAF9641278.1 hypothetical protein BFW01_g638 [Lasiodiplodia theobromae]